MSKATSEGEHYPLRSQTGKYSCIYTGRFKNRSCEHDFLFFRVTARRWRNLLLTFGGILHIKIFIIFK